MKAPPLSLQTIEAGQDYVTIEGHREERVRVRTIIEIKGANENFFRGRNRETRMAETSEKLEGAGGQRRVCSREVSSGYTITLHKRLAPNRR